MSQGLLQQIRNALNMVKKLTKLDRTQSTIHQLLGKDPRANKGQNAILIALWIAKTALASDILYNSVQQDIQHKDLFFFKQQS